MPSFEYRPQQLEMALAVARSFDGEQNLMVESGTGTGKSLAYLIPAILWAVENQKKVVISTYTKTLQQQILHHDIPFLIEKLGLSFRYSLCMGYGNYLSLRRLKRASQTELFARPEENGQFQEIVQWAGETATGAKVDLPFEPLASVWEDVGRDKDLCMGKNCETYDMCFYFKERRKWFGAHLLIVNHHLFFANLGNNGAVLPRYDAVVFDEAQNIEEAATSFLGLEISNSSLFYFLNRLYNPKTQKGKLTRIEKVAASENLKKQVTVVRDAGWTFFERVLEEYGRQTRVIRFYKPSVLRNDLDAPLQELYEALKTMEGQVPSDEDRLELSAAANRCLEFGSTLKAILNQHIEDYVYWLEVAVGKRITRATLKGVPVNVSKELQEQLFDKTRRVVMTSATLTTNRTFDFIKSRIGYQPQEEMILDSPFDYRSQALLYIPRDMPEPTDEANRYVEAVTKKTADLIHAAGGKTFILFTSYELMNRVYTRLETLMGHYQLLKQGGLSTREMIERFKKKPSVIFGTNSFWQGIDIPGDALKSVIITKIPFDVPNEPLTEARLEELRRQSINPFVHYQVPRAIVQLKQGFGRLIRNKTDTGVVTILDARIHNRGYGKQFLDSLPPCRVANELAQVKEFLSAGREGNNGHQVPPDMRNVAH